MGDRVVHGLNAAKDAEVVRYDRSGKWYLESLDGSKRRLISVADAAHIATLGTAYLGRYGGARFTSLVNAAK